MASVAWYENLEGEENILGLLLEAFPAASPESIAAAYTKSLGDPNATAEMLSLIPPTNCSGRVETICKTEPNTWKVIGHKNHQTQRDGSTPATEGGALGSSRNVERTMGNYASAEVNLIQQPSTAIRNKNMVCDAPGNAGRLYASAVRNGCGSSFHPASNICFLPPMKASPVDKKKVSASVGTVSSFIPRKSSVHGDFGTSSKLLSTTTGSRKGVGEMHERKKSKMKVEKLEPKGAERQRAVEELLYSMMGNDSELGMDTVRDILVHFAGDAQEALDTLLCINSSNTSGDSISNQKCVNDDPHANHLPALLEAFPEKDPAEVVIAFQACNEDLDHAATALSQEASIGSLPMLCHNGLALGQEHSTTRLLLERLQAAFPAVEPSTLFEVLQFCSFSYKKAVQVLSEAGLKHAGQKQLDPSEVLQDLFDWNKDVEEQSTFGKGGNNWKKLSSARTEQSLEMVIAEVKTRPTERPMMDGNKAGFQSYGDWTDYKRHRHSANEHWRLMKEYVHQGTIAHSKGDHARAAILNEKGSEYKKLFCEASSRANKYLFHISESDVDTNVTIDLHEQHVDESLDLLKVHLRKLLLAPSIETLTVITGQGTHSPARRAKIKPAVTRYLDKKGIPWTEINPGCLVVKMADVQRLRF